METAAQHVARRYQMRPVVPVELRSAVTLLFLTAGLVNIAVPFHRADLITWGYPDGSQIVIGGAEWVASAMLWRPRTRSAGYLAMGRYWRERA